MLVAVNGGGGGGVVVVVVGLVVDVGVGGGGGFRCCWWWSRCWYSWAVCRVKGISTELKDTVIISTFPLIACQLN